MNPARVCVFAGSSPGGRPEYLSAARRLGERLAAEGLGVVYGGASIGLMGALADAALARGGEVIGVIPHGLAAREVAHAGLTKLHVVRSMHERKALMADLAGAFVALPGGLGTLEELAEIATWSMLGIHRKPLGLLDVNGYWSRLLAHLDHSVAEGFLRADQRDTVLAAADVDALLAALRAFHPPERTRWIQPSET